MVVLFCDGQNHSISQCRLGVDEIFWRNNPYKYQNYLFLCNDDVAFHL